MKSESGLMHRIEAALELVKDLSLKEIKELQVKRFGFSYQIDLSDYIYSIDPEEYLKYERGEMKHRLSRGLVKCIEEQFGLPITVKTECYFETHRADLYVLVQKEKPSVKEK